ncbi:hypothetical protein F5887DRAFT_931438 [Amanita rubescens]|nr:hypothetical protein F5887DRAFT_931438 [Amanita rubescens]
MDAEIELPAVLDSFDTRLAKLEKSILPLYTSAQVLTRRTQNIDKTLLKIDELGSQNEDLDAEEALILRGPQPGQLDTYKSAIECLNALITFKSPSSDHHNAPARLVETGAKKLTLLYTKLVAEGSSGLPQEEHPLNSQSYPSLLISSPLYVL